MVVILEYIPFGSSFLTSCKNYGRLKIPRNLIISDRRPALENITVILLKTKYNSKLFREMKFNILEKKISLKCFASQGWYLFRSAIGNSRTRRVCKIKFEPSWIITRLSPSEPCSAIACCTSSSVQVKSVDPDVDASGLLQITKASNNFHIYLTKWLCHVSQVKPNLRLDLSKSWYLAVAFVKQKSDIENRILSVWRRSQSHHHKQSSHDKTTN